MELNQLLEQTTALHRHLCPRQVLGVRIGMYAAELLELDLPQTDKRLFTFVETDGCFADGVSVATGCWLGRRTMRLVDHGKVAATCVDTKTGRAFRLWPSEQARTAAREALPEARSRWHAQLEAYQWLPNDVLLRAQPVQLSLSLETLIARPGSRTQCARCGEEILNQREIERAGELLCPHCAGINTYWQ